MIGWKFILVALLAAVLFRDAAGQVVASRRGYKQKEFTRIEKTGGDDTEVTENTVQLVTVERVGEEQLMLGSKNTIRTVIKNKSDDDITLVKVQGAIIYRAKGGAVVGSEEYPLEVRPSDHPIKAGEDMEFDYEARFPSGRIISPSDDHSVEITVWFRGPARPEDHPDASDGDRYTATWRATNIPLKERHSLLDLEMMGIVVMTAVGGAMALYVVAQVTPSSAIGSSVNRLVDSFGKPKRSAPVVAKKPQAAGEPPVNEWLQGTAADQRAKSASRPKSRGKQGTPARDTSGREGSKKEH